MNVSLLSHWNSLDGQYRSPEEFANRDLDEKIDIFSFGNNIYGLVSCIFITLKLSPLTDLKYLLFRFQSLADWTLGLLRR